MAMVGEIKPGDRVQKDSQTGTIQSGVDKVGFGPYDYKNWKVFVDQLGGVVTWDTAEMELQQVLVIYPDNTEASPTGYEYAFPSPNPIFTPETGSGGTSSNLAPGPVYYEQNHQTTGWNEDSPYTLHSVAGIGLFGIAAIGIIAFMLSKRR